ncbi:MAG: hypothetical protein M3Q27_00870 [Actinomycetota bacterium]|nr:hypothetical protein [Actinomycetota bacterium]
MAALREDGAAAVERSLRLAHLTGSLLVLVSAGATAAGVAAEGGRGASFVGVSALAGLIGVATLSPVLARPILAVLGLPNGACSGPPLRSAPATRPATPAVRRPQPPH